MISAFRVWWDRRDSFRKVFHDGQWRDDQGLTVHARRVLVHLREFCKASESCIVVDRQGRYDTHATAVAEGRREVLLRIQHILNLSDEVLLAMRDPDEERKHDGPDT